MVVRFTSPSACTVAPPPLNVTETSVSKSFTIILLITDDDDVVAMISREMFDYDEILKPRLVSIEGTTLGNNSVEFTTLSTIYDSNIDILKENNSIIKSLGKLYKYSFEKNYIKKFKNNSNFRIIGMGGSSLGTKAIYDFLKDKISKNFEFIDNLNPSNKKKSKKNFVNLVVSKSGNTIETIVNFNTLVKNKEKNIFITEKSNNYLSNLAHKLKTEIIEHKNFIGGRFSVMSEVGMLPAQLMGLNENKFKRYKKNKTNDKIFEILIYSVLN